MATLNVVTFEADTIVGPPFVHQDLFNHLSGGPNGTFFIVEGLDTEHAYLFTNPVELLDTLAENNICLIPLQQRAIPTLSEWGYITLSVLAMIVGIYYFKFRRKAHSNI